MEGWRRTTIGDACEVQSGSGFPERLQGTQDAAYPFYKVSDMNLPGNEREMHAANNYISEEVRAALGARLFPKGTVIFPKVGGAIATNKKRRTTRPCCIDNNVMGLIPKPDIIDEDYLLHLLAGIDIYEFSNKANPPSIRQSTVQEWPIVLPPLPEQKRIVAILDEAFEGIDKAIANTEKKPRECAGIV